MASEMQKKGVIVEFDFAAMDGAGLLFETTKKVLAEGEIPFDLRAEAQYLAGGNYLGALSEYFAVVKTKKTAAKAAKDLSDAFRLALNEAVPGSVTPAFRAFVKALVARNLRVVISTRADVDAVRDAFADLLGDNVILYQETAATYGSVKWDAWRRACVSNHLRNSLALAITGSGYGVKSALLAGMGSIAVTSDHVAYQDFGGADDVVKVLDENAARIALRILRAG